MTFLTDHDVYQRTVVWLEHHGHDVIRVKDIGFERADDSKVLKEAGRRDRILITRDTDFGALAHFSSDPAAGIILLRGQPGLLENIHKQLGALLDEFTEQQLKKSTAVVEPTRFRRRKRSS
jgi:predicted nuclease of predicted toxin-antitoxin system